MNVFQRIRHKLFGTDYIASGGEGGWMNVLPVRWIGDEPFEVYVHDSRQIRSLLDRLHRGNIAPLTPRITRWCIAHAKMDEMTGESEDVSLRPILTKQQRDAIEREISKSYKTPRQKLGDYTT